MTRPDPRIPLPIIREHAGPYHVPPVVVAQSVKPRANVRTSWARRWLWRIAWAILGVLHRWP